MFGLGWPEIIVLVLCGFSVIGGTLGLIAFSIYMSRKSKGDDNSGALAELRAENRRLREENDRLRKGLGSGG
jgi:cell division protein FtsB